MAVLNNGGDPKNVRELLQGLSYDLRPSTLAPVPSGDPDLRTNRQRILPNTERVALELANMPQIGPMEPRRPDVLRSGDAPFRTIRQEKDRQAEEAAREASATMRMEAARMTPGLGELIDLAEFGNVLATGKDFYGEEQDPAMFGGMTAAGYVIPNVLERPAKAAWRVLKKFPDKLTRRQMDDMDLADEAREGIEANLRQAHAEVYELAPNENVRQIKSLMSGSKLESMVDKDGFINVEAVQKVLNSPETSAAERDVLEKVLGELVDDTESGYFRLNKKGKPQVHYNNLRDNVAMDLDITTTVRDITEGEGGDTFERQGIDDLFPMFRRKKPDGTLLKPAPDQGPEWNYTTAAARAREGANETAQTWAITRGPFAEDLVNTNDGHFGPDIVAHYRTFSRPDQPDILYVTELQSDPFQARRVHAKTGMPVRGRTDQPTVGRASITGGIKITDEMATDRIAATDDMINLFGEIKEKARIALDPNQPMEVRTQAIKDVQANYNQGFAWSGAKWDKDFMKQALGGEEGDVVIPAGARIFDRWRTARPSPRMAAQMRDEAQTRAAFEQARRDLLETDEMFNELNQLIGELDRGIEQFTTYRTKLGEGYRGGDMSPRAARIMKDQDQFIIAHILQNKRHNQRTLRFPTGDTTRDIQGYDTAEQLIADFKDDLVEDTELFDTYQQRSVNAASSMERNPMDHTPEGFKGKKLSELTPEEWHQWANADQISRAEMGGMSAAERRAAAASRSQGNYIEWRNEYNVASNPELDDRVREMNNAAFQADGSATAIREVEEGTYQGLQSQQGIMAGYDRLPKVLKKHGLEAKMVTDEFGNTWWEVDMKARDQMNVGEIRAYYKGGKLTLKKRKPYKVLKHV